MNPYIGVYFLEAVLPWLLVKSAQIDFKVSFCLRSLASTLPFWGLSSRIIGAAGLKGHHKFDRREHTFDRYLTHNGCLLDYLHIIDSVGIEDRVKVFICGDHPHKLIVQALDLTVCFEEEISAVSLKSLSFGLSLHVVQLF